MLEKVVQVQLPNGFEVCTLASGRGVLPEVEGIAARS